MIDARLELAELAELEHTRVREANLIFPGIGEDPFDQRIAFRRQKSRVDWYGNGRVFLIEATCNSGIVFAAVTPSFFMTLENLVTQVEAVRIFAGVRQSPMEWLEDANNRALVSGLQLQPDEHLLVAQNGVSLVALPSGVDFDSKRLDSFLALIDGLPPAAESNGREAIDGLTFEPKNAPTALRRLHQEVVRWSAGDDEERSERVEHANTEELEALVHTVTPSLPAIDAYVEQQTEPYTDEAMLLMSLAQATIEAVHELARRSENNSH